MPLARQFFVLPPCPQLWERPEIMLTISSVGRLSSLVLCSDRAGGTSSFFFLLGIGIFPSESNFWSLTLAVGISQYHAHGLYSISNTYSSPSSQVDLSWEVVDRRTFISDLHQYLRSRGGQGDISIEQTSKMIQFWILCKFGNSRLSVSFFLRGCFFSLDWVWASSSRGSTFSHFLSFIPPSSRGIVLLQLKHISLHAQVAQHSSLKSSCPRRSSGDHFRVLTSRLTLRWTCWGL